MASPVDIPPDHLEIVQDILQKYLPPGINVYVFGSRADWTTKDSSDLDLALEGGSELEYGVVGALEDAFEESSLPYEVDVIDLNQVSDSFRRIVEARKTPLDYDHNLDSGNVDWRWVPVSNVAVIVIGGTPSRSVKKYWNGKIPWASAKDVASVSGRYLYSPQEFITAQGLESSAAKLMPKGTVIITARGTVGALAQLGQDMTFNQTCYAVVSRDAVCQDFLFYALKGTLHSMHALTYGTIFDTITRKTFDNWRIPLPSLSEQRTISHVLGTLDDRIELSRRTNQALEEMAQTLFKSWFVDFDPVRAKMDGRWRRGESLPGLPAHLYGLFPDRLVDSDLGKIPNGWTVNAFENCFSLTMGQSPPSNTYNDDGKGLPFFQGSADFGLRYPKNRKYCTAPARIAQTDDTLVSVRAPVGAINMAWEECCAGRGVAVLRHKSGSRSFTYYSIWSLQHDLQQYEQMGTVFGAITRKQLEMLPVIEPPLHLADCFEACVSVWDERIRLNTSESVSLMRQRDALLPKLISGELRANPSHVKRSNTNISGSPSIDSKKEKLKSSAYEGAASP